MTTITTSNNAIRLTTEQQVVMNKLSSFMQAKTVRGTFVLNGAAGTGKTTIIGQVRAKALELGLKVMMMAPTGRAAKVLSGKVGTRAQTIHSALFYTSPILNGKGEIIGYEFIKRPAYSDEPALFIVDEASMVSDVANADGYMRTHEGVLTSLINYCFSASAGSKILFVGDKCQLGPVGARVESKIPGLDKNYLAQAHGCAVLTADLEQVMRQADGSQIAHAAKEIRENVIATNTNYSTYKFGLDRLGNQQGAVKSFCDAYDPTDPTKVVMIASLNVTVNALNTAIRKELYGSPNPVEPGEYLVANKNTIIAGMPILNGEIFKVKQVMPNSQITIEGIRFVTVEIEYTNYEGDIFTEKRNLIIDVLEAPEKALSDEGQRRLVAHRIKNNQAYRESKSEHTDPYLNAIQARFSYALSCHKAQGGEWNYVIVSEYATPKGEPYRFLYTAVTRASKRLHLFKADFVQN